MKTSLQWSSGFLNPAIKKKIHKHILFAGKILLSSPLHKTHDGGILKEYTYLIFYFYLFLIVEKLVIGNTDKCELNRMLYMFSHVVIKNSGSASNIYRNCDNK